jgi:DNA polymerase III gamma/tau subunit
MTIAVVRELEEQSRYMALNPRGRAYIIDEAHNIRSQVREALLSLLENPGKRCLVIFTSTAKDGMLFDDTTECDTFTSRVRLFKTAPGAISELVQAIKDAVVKAGYEYIEAIALKAASVSKGNYRAALSEYETLYLAAC